MTSIGEKLRDAGWRQGSLFSGEGLTLARNIVQIGSGDPGLDSRCLTNDDVCVIASQDCDVVSDTEEDVEALVCERIEIAKAQSLVNPRRYSARFFPVDADAGLVALAASRLLIAKEVLLQREAKEWPTPARFQQFVRWLGRRYTRPALANDFVAQFQDPTVKALSRLAKKQPGTMQAFTQAVTELRLVPPDAQQPPFDVELIFLLDDVGIGEEAVNALDAVETEIRGAVDPELVRITDVRIRSEEQMSVAEYFSSVPLFLDSMTYRGNEIQGAELPTTD